MDQTPQLKIKGIPDIVLCVDATASMGGCLEQLKAHLGTFIAELEKPREVQPNVLTRVSDWRLRLLPFRDILHNKVGMVNDFPFCTTAAEFQRHLADPRSAAATEGSGGLEESALDALYLAVRTSEWRPEKDAHRFVILFTDAATHPEMHPSTAGSGPYDVGEVIQSIRTYKIKPILFAPKASEYEAIYAAVRKDRGDIVTKFSLFPSRNEAVAFFAMNTDAARAHFAEVLNELAKTISQSSSEEL